MEGQTDEIPLIGVGDIWSFNRPLRLPRGDVSEAGNMEIDQRGGSGAFQETKRSYAICMAFGKCFGDRIGGGEHDNTANYALLVCLPHARPRLALRFERRNDVVLDTAPLQGIRTLQILLQALYPSWVP